MLPEQIVASCRAHYIHGSEDSLDKDMFFVVDQLSPVLQDNKLACDILSKQHAANGNLITIENGCVTTVFKGTVDEVNNSLLATYPLHKQSSPQLVTQKVDRDIGLKVLRTIRGLLSYCSRTTYREKVKAALKAETLQEKLEVLEQLPFGSLTDYGKASLVEVHKFFAFQLGQTLALMEGKELFTKSAVAAYLGSDFAPFLARQTAEFRVFDPLLERFIREIRTKISTISDGTVIHSSHGRLSVKAELYLSTIQLCELPQVQTPRLLVLPKGGIRLVQ